MTSHEGADTITRRRWRVFCGRALHVVPALANAGVSPTNVAECLLRSRPRFGVVRNGRTF